MLQSHLFSSWLLQLLYSDLHIARPGSRLRGGTDDPVFADVTLHVRLSDSALSSWSLSVEIESGVIGIFSAKLSIPVSVGSAENGDLFFPKGYGEAFSNPSASTGGALSATYPASGASMQFMAIAGSTSSSSEDDATAMKESATGNSGVYVAAHDGSGYIKDLGYAHVSITRGVEDLLSAEIMAAASTNVATTRRESRNSHQSRIPDFQYSFQDSSAETTKMNAATHVTTVAGSGSGSGLSVLSITVYPKNSGEAMVSGDRWSTPYEIAVGIVEGVNEADGRPLWYY